MPAIATPSFLSWMGIAKETVNGTPVSASSFIPLTTMTPKDNITYLEDKGMRGAPVEVYDYLAGPRSTTYDMAGDVFADTFGFPLAGILGDVAVSGASAPYGTTLSALNSGTGQPPSYTVTDYDGAKARQYPGAMFTDVSLTFTSEGLLQHTSKVTGFASAIQATPPARTFSAVRAVPVWQGVAKIAGVANATLLDGSIDLKRSADIIVTVANSQSPQQIFLGPLVVSGKLTLVTDNAETQYNNYLNGSVQALDLSWASGAGATLQSLGFHMSQCIFTAADLSRGKAYTTTAVTFSAIANTSDVGVSGGYSPIKAALQNAVPSGTYA